MKILRASEVQEFTEIWILVCNAPKIIKNIELFFLGS